MKGDGATTVIIRGQYRGHPLTATWGKQMGTVGGKPGQIWSLTIQYRGRQRRFAVDRYDKPCWTVSTLYVDRVFQPAAKQESKPKQRLQAAKPVLKVIG